MIHFLLQILGVRVSRATNIADWGLEFRYGPAGEILLLGLALAAVAVWFYRRSTLKMPGLARYGMAALRVALFGLLLLLMLQPVLRLGVDGQLRQSLVVLLDASTSMRIRDTGQAREETVRATLPSVLGPLAKDYDLLAYGFGKDVEEIPGGWEGYKAHSPVTALGDALREVLRRQRGQPVAGVLLVTDGGINAGTPALDAAALARQEKVPLYLYGVGLTAPKDIIVQSLFAEDVAFVRDELNVVVRVRSQGLANEKATIKLTLGDEVVDEREMVLEGDGEHAVEMKCTPATIGEFELRAVVAPRPDEAVKDNNAQTKPVRVVDTRIKVLVIEQSPRWEFRYLQAMLLRDRRMEAKLLLFDADPGVTQGADSPYVPQLPTKEDLFRYDVIVLGDVDPKLFTPDQLANLRDYVAKYGGGLVMIAGRRFAPLAYARTPLEAALPVDIESARSDGDLPGDKPIPLELTPAGKESPMLQLADQPEESLKVWRNLPPVYWVVRVARVKPAAEVLLDAADPRADAREKSPVLVLQRYGLGQTLFMGTDSTWRWRKNAGDKYFTLLWGQVVQRMALARLLGEAKRTQLSTDRQSYVTGDRVTIYARLYTAAFDPINEPAVIGRYTPRHGQSREVTLRPLAGQPGMYRGEFIAPVAGACRFVVERDPETKLDFLVREPQFEFGQTAMNEPLLKEMAAVSGGTFLRQEDLSRLPALLARQVETVRSYVEVEVWSSPLVLMLVVLMAGAEWALRKRFQLK